MVIVSDTIFIPCTKDKLFTILRDVRTVVNWLPAVKSIDWLTESDQNHSDLGAARRCHFADGSSVVEICTELETGQDRDHIKFELTEFSAPAKSLSLFFDVIPDGNGAKLTIGQEFEPMDESMADTMKGMFQPVMTKVAGQIAEYISAESKVVVSHTASVHCSTKDKIFSILRDVRTVVNWNSAVKSVDWLTASDENHSNLGASRRCHLADGSSIVETCTELETGQDRDHIKFELTEFSAPAKSLSLYFDVVSDGDGVKLTVGQEFKPMDESMTDMMKSMFQPLMIKVAGQIVEYVSLIDEA